MGGNNTQFQNYMRAQFMSAYMASENGYNDINASGSLNPYTGSGGPPKNPGYFGQMVKGSDGQIYQFTNGKWRRAA